MGTLISVKRTPPITCGAAPYVVVCCIPNGVALYVVVAVGITGVMVIMGCIVIIGCAITTGAGATVIMGVAKVV